MQKILLALLLALAALGGRAQISADFATLVERLGLAEGAEDLSRDTVLKLPEPRMAYVNLTGFTGMPTMKTTRKEGWLEMYDGEGHYLKKRVVIKGQGGSSLKLPKRNFACQFSEDDWTERRTPDIRFGKWVKQDAFHFKAFYTDFLRGIGEVGYKVFAQVVADREPYWVRGGYDDPDETRARCFPDAFPCAVYQNGAFYGIFAWQLKKHRKNMNQKKTTAEHIHLDGNLQDSFLFRGTVQWGQFEVRNPKGLYRSDGSLYDGNRPGELMDEQNEAYDLPDDTPDTREAKRRTAQVKRHVTDMSRYWQELNELEKRGADTLAMRREIESRYDIGSLLDYYVFFYVQCNGDGTLKNWQWFTYDGHKWLVTPYDLDQTFGINLYGVVRPAAHTISDLVSGPFWWVHRYYQPDIRQRYATLRDRRVLDAENIMQVADDWHDRVGNDFYALEMAAWPNSPCYANAICSPGWEVADDWERYDETPNYSAFATYQEGDLCKLEGRLWRATATVKGTKPYVLNANKDDIERLRRWVADRLAYLDDYFAYTPAPDAILSPTLPDTAPAPPNGPSAGPRALIGIFSPSGAPLPHPVPGVNLYRYSDGTTRKVVVR